MSRVAEVTALLEQGRAEAALDRFAPAAHRKDADLDTLTAYALALKAVGSLDEALQVYERAAGENPASAAAEHNVAGLLGDLDRNAEAADRARAALARGGDAPETWLVLGRALQGAGRLAEAEEALGAAVARRPGYYEPLRDLSQLIWMRSGDVDAALAPVEAALRRWPHHPVFTALAAKVETAGGRAEAAYARLSTAAQIAGGQSPDLELAASNLAATLRRPNEALAHAERALKLERTNVTAAVLACDAWLGLGQADRAARMAERLLAIRPDDQEVLARLATAWRMLGDPRYGALYDYAAFVRAYRIDVPAGWSDLPSYLAELTAALTRVHGFGAHPFDQSLRGGTQTATDLRAEKHPAIAAFFTAIDGPIRRHMAVLGEGSDPHRRRNTGDYALAGAWSVRLQPDGFHVDHIHPMGWLSSACYLALPESVKGEGREGWIKFGEPGVHTAPPLRPEHFVKPEPGLLVLFPSYMWHGTVPFGGSAPRLTAAFDVVPK